MLPCSTSVTVLAAIVAIRSDLEIDSEAWRGFGNLNPHSHAGPYWFRAVLSVWVNSD